MPTAEETTAADTAAAAQAASAAAVTEKAAADKASADNAAADQAAAAAANAGKTPAQLAAAKTAADTETARKAADQAKAPEKYELTLPKESAHLTDADLPIIAAEAKALGLTNAQAQALVNARHDQLTQVGAAFLAEAKADPEIGGAQFDTTVKHALAGRDWLFPPGPSGDLIKSWFDRTGLGNHKEFLRAMARIGRIRADDSTGQGTGAGTASKTEGKSAAEVLYGSDVAAT